MKTIIHLLFTFGKSRKLRILSACMLLAVLYWSIDAAAVARSVSGLHWGYLGLAMLMFLPQTFISALRWRRMVAPVCALTTSEALRQTLVASAWNLFVPSKLGDLTKAAMLPLERRSAFIFCVGQVFKEKVLDVLALAAIMVFGWIAGMPAWVQVVIYVLVALWGCARWANRMPGGSSGKVAISLVLWSLHLIQIDLFLKSAGVFVAWHVAAARIPAAIFAGLLPVTFWGIGTRDAALVWLFADVAPAATMAAVGLLTASRYLIPGLVGIVLGAYAEMEQPAWMKPVADPPQPRRAAKPKDGTAVATAASPRG